MLHENQGGPGRHKCCICAYVEGFRIGLVGAISDNDLVSIEAEEQMIETPPAAREFIEGERRIRLVNQCERDSRLRRVTIAIHGPKCVICGFDFGEFYGGHGSGFIEVHHLKAVSTYRGKTKVDPEQDMTCVCANCHRMIHRYRDRQLTPDELRELVMQNRRSDSGNN